MRGAKANMEQNHYAELQEAQQELRELEQQYVGHTPAQQKTLDALMRIDQNYLNKKGVLDAKIEYLKKLVEKENYDSAINRIKKEDAYFDAMLDNL